MLIDEALSMIRPNALLINSGRGELIATDPLLKRVKQRQFRVALDVWENEPAIDIELMDNINLATPHIAGYSLEGKEKGTWMIYEALCQFLSIPPDINKRECLNQEQSLLNAGNKPPFSSLSELLLECYDIVADDMRMRPRLKTKKSVLSVLINCGNLIPFVGNILIICLTVEPMSLFRSNSKYFNKSLFKIGSFIRCHRKNTLS